MNLRETNMTFTDVESCERESMRGDKAKRETGLADLWETRKSSGRMNGMSNLFS